MPKPRKRVDPESSSEEISDPDVGEEGDMLEEVGEDYAVVDEWESDDEDDENEDAPGDMDAECVYTN